MIHHWDCQIFDKNSSNNHRIYTHSCRLLTADHLRFNFAPDFQLY